jgi:hypothetical protein
MGGEQRVPRISHDMVRRQTRLLIGVYVICLFSPFRRPLGPLEGFIKALTCQRFAPLQQARQFITNLWRLLVQAEDQS